MSALARKRHWEAQSECLLSGISGHYGCSGADMLEHNAIVVGRHFDNLCKFQSVITLMAKKVHRGSVAMGRRKNVQGEGGLSNRPNSLSQSDDKLAGSHNAGGRFWR